MRTNIDLDDNALKQLMRRTGARTKREAVNASLKMSLSLLDQGDAILSLRGIGWEGDLKELRSSREFEPIG